jgi:hypothetical protein
MKKETKIQELERRITVLELCINPRYKTFQCPPHNYIQRAYPNAWGAIVPPPTMFCTKCGNLS